MLIELRAENYAVIDHAIASFGPGLNLLTGETGAGKSILVDALALLMGGKASAELVRHGAEKAVVSCVFESTPGAENTLEENGIDSEGAEIILRREILSSGKGRVFVNNQPATVAVLRQLAPELALVHAQSETLSSFDQSQQRTLLDRFGGISTDAVAEAHARWRAAQEKLDELERGEQDRLRMVDLWTYQRNEIAQAHLIAGEDDELETEKRVLANAEKLYAAAMSGFDQLYEGSASAEVSLRAALRNVEELARFDPRFESAAEQLASARAVVGDIASTLRDYAEGIDASPERLAEIEDRLAALDRLRRKYGRTVAEVIAFGEDVARKLAEVEDRDGLLKTLRADLASAASSYRAAATALTAERKSAAARLAKLAESQINSLAMKVRFEIAVTCAEEVGQGFSPDKRHAPARGALAPEGSSAHPGSDAQSSVTGHDFSRADTAAKGKGASAPEASSARPGSDAQSSVTGHDFSRAENASKQKGALAPEAKSASAGALKGTGFSPYIHNPKNEGASAPEGRSAHPGSDVQSSVTGHDFSRAENAPKIAGASAPEAKSASANALKGTGFSPYINDPKTEAPDAHWTPHGWDHIEFRIATNPGEPLKPLTEIASGGEMSRVLLALKVAVEETSSKTRKKNPTPRTLVFDEIDIGIGGRAAEAVGHKLKALSRGQQVLCVTHLPQIAAFADQHFLIDKREDRGRTKTQIRLLDPRDRTHEVARMLSGAKVTETSLQHAAQMIAASR
jgi:DNA repair protein RecN (Recombination protein N)